jgi:O-antigen polymerase
LTVRCLRHSLFIVAVTLPWLWPFTPGPSANVGPLLAAWSCLLVAVLLLVHAPSPGELLRDALPASWCIAAGISALIGLAQYFGSAPDVVLVSASKLGEAYGNLRQKNQFASLMSLGLAALVWHAGFIGPVRWVGVTLLAVANAASASRTGLLECIAITMLAVVWPPRDRRRIALCCTALGAYAVASLVLPQILEALRGEALPNVFSRAVSDLGCSSRRVLWANVWELVSQRPLVGWGIGELAYAHYATLYQGARFCDILDNAHNLPLHLAVELGLPAAVLLLAVIGWAVVRGKPWRARTNADQLSWAALLVVAIHSLVEYPLWYGPFQIAAVISVCALFPLPSFGAAARRVWTAVALLGMGAIFWALAIYSDVSQAYKSPEDRIAAFRSDPVTAAGSPLVFRAQLRFAELSLSEVTPATAPRVLELSRQLLHYSPEPMVIEKLIESAILLGYLDEARWHAERFRAAFPQRYAEWRSDAAAAHQLPGIP